MHLSIFLQIAILTSNPSETQNQGKKWAKWRKMIGENRTKTTIWQTKKEI